MKNKKKWKSDTKEQRAYNKKMARKNKQKQSVFLSKITI